MYNTRMYLETFILAYIMVRCLEGIYIGRNAVNHHGNQQKPKNCHTQSLKL